MEDFYQTSFFALCGLVLSLVAAFIFHWGKMFCGRLERQEATLEKMLLQNVTLLKKELPRWNAAYKRESSLSDSFSTNSI